MISQMLPEIEETEYGYKFHGLFVTRTTMIFEGEEVHLTNEGQRALMKFVNSIDEFKKNPIEKFANRVKKAGWNLHRLRMRSETYKPEHKIWFRDVSWTTNKTENGEMVLDEVFVGKEDWEPSRFRFIQELNKEKVQVFRLCSGQKDPKIIEMVLKDICPQGWEILGNHNQYYVYYEPSYFEEMVHHVFPDVADIILNDQGQQKCTLGSMMTHKILTDGRCLRESNKVINLKDYPVHEEGELSLCDGGIIVLKAEDMWEICNEVGIPLTACIHGRLVSWNEKGTIQIETERRPAGIYPRGLGMRDPETGKKLIPENIRLSHLVIVDHSAINGSKGKVNINHQIFAYTKNKVLKQEIINETKKTAQDIVAGTIKARNETYNLLTGIGRHDLLAETPKGFKNSLLYREASFMLIGDAYKEDGSLNNGRTSTGLIRGLPVDGEYAFIGVSPYLKPQCGDEPAEVMLTEDLARILNVKMGDILHTHRSPSLPTGDVLVRCKVVEILTRMDIWKSIPEHIQRRLRKQGMKPSKIQLGKMYWVNVCHHIEGASTIDRMGGDEDGDKGSIYTKVREWELKHNTIIDSDPVLPNLYAPEILDDNWDWRKQEDRYLLGGKSQTRITDWQARRAMDIIDGYVDGKDTDNIRWATYQSFMEEEVRLFHAWRIQTLISLKKKPIEDSHMNDWDIPRGICPIDVYRQIETILGKDKGPYTETIQDGQVYLEESAEMTEDGPITIKDLLPRLKDYPLGEVIQAILEAYDQLWQFYLLDEKGKYETTREGNLDQSTIRWKSQVNWTKRRDRIRKVLHFGSKTAPFEMESYITGRRNLHEGKSILQIVAESVMLARKPKLIYNGQEIQAFVRKGEEENTLELRKYPGSHATIVKKEEIEFLEESDDTQRQKALCQRIRHWIPKESNRLIEKYGATVPEHLSSLYDSPEEWIIACIEMSILNYLADTPVGNSATSKFGRSNWWTYTIDMVSPETVALLLGEESALDEVQEKQHASHAH